MSVNNAADFFGDIFKKKKNTTTKSNKSVGEWNVEEILEFEFIRMFILKNS